MEDIEHVHEHKDINLSKPVADYRKEMVKHAYKHYNLHEFKAWAADVCSELVQQLSRISTEKFDKEDLIKSMLMTEDVCSILRMLLAKDDKMIEELATDIYCEFSEMLKAHGLIVEGECSYNKPAKVTVASNSLK